ncbi:MAG: S-formylglutathione hydrolase [Pseudomonadota bacterium]|nr:S-formylglutathione hydrolase [Pseudomonadota bacterium]
MKKKSANKIFEGTQYVYSHYSETCRCDMTFAVFLPEESLHRKVPVIWFLSGLTCTHENAMFKAGAQQWAAEKGVAIIYPDTSPRGENIPNDDSFDLGQGAGFYLNSTEKPWKENFQMEEYIVTELQSLVFENLNLNYNRQGVMGHSMGGMGALNFAIKNPKQYLSVSAFSPIVNPTESDWGRKQFKSYLGGNVDRWKEYDPCLLLKSLGTDKEILVDQGTNDEFLELLQPNNFLEKFDRKEVNGNFRYQKGYDHSYFFVSTFIRDHIYHHIKYLSD